MANKIHIVVLRPSEWDMSERVGIYASVFDTYRPKEIDRVDFVLLGELEGKPLGFLSCKAFDSQTVYCQFGGAFPEVEKVYRARAYQQALIFLKERYKTVFTFVDNTNVPMLRLAMANGFLIEGIRMSGSGKVLVELYAR